MKTLAITAFSLLLIATASSCKKDVFCAKGNGNVVSQQREVTNFSEIRNSMCADIYLVQDPNYSVRVEADENLQDIILATVDNGVLNIHTKNDKCISSKTKINVYVTTPEVNALKVSGSGLIQASGLIATTDLYTKISGSGEIRLNQLDVETMETLISGSGDLSIAGTSTAGFYKAKISGSGEIYGYDFPVTHVDAHISGSGEMVVYPLNRLDAKISGCGDIIYRGAPAILNTTISGSGTVRAY